MVESCFGTQIKFDGAIGTHDLSYSKLSAAGVKFEKALTVQEFLSQYSTRRLSQEYNAINGATFSEDHINSLVKETLATNGLNRYSDILPFKSTAVSLSSQNTLTGSNYINANYMRTGLSSDDDMIIATQGPTDDSIPSFWQMVFEQDINMIIMLCNYQEGGRIKCAGYMPPAAGLEMGNFSVKRSGNAIKMGSSLVVTPLMVTHDGQEKNVKQIQFTAWPDHGVPQSDEIATINFIVEEMLKNRIEYPQKRIAVHCSAGVGRTGTIISLFGLIRGLRYAQVNNLEPKLSIFSMVRRLREYRISQVQTVDQYHFLYAFMNVWLKSQFKEVPEYLQ